MDIHTNKNRAALAGDVSRRLRRLAVENSTRARLDAVAALDRLIEVAVHPELSRARQQVKIIRTDSSWRQQIVSWSDGWADYARWVSGRPD